MKDIFDFPEEILIYKRLRVDAIEAKRVAWYFDLVSRFARPVLEICIIVNTVMRKLNEQWGMQLKPCQRELLSPAHLRYVDALYATGAP